MGGWEQGGGAASEETWLHGLGDGQAGGYRWRTHDPREVPTAELRLTEEVKRTMRSRVTLVWKECSEGWEKHIVIAESACLVRRGEEAERDLAAEEGVVERVQVVSVQRRHHDVDHLARRLVGVRVHGEELGRAPHRRRHHRVVAGQGRTRWAGAQVAVANTRRSEKC